MNIEIDTHTHTLVSGHAYSTICEMARTAAEKGLKGLAITEHAPGMPGSCHLYYFQNLHIVPRQRYGVELLMGAELNILNEEGEVDLPARLSGELDLIIASIHLPCYSGEKTKEKITKAYLNAMEADYIDIIGHPDDGRLPVDMKLLVKKAKETGTLLEVNNSSLRPDGFRKNTWENCQEMLRDCKAQGAMIVLGSDAHVDVDVAGYEYCYKALEECEFPEELVANVTMERLKASVKHGKKL